MMPFVLLTWKREPHYLFSSPGGIKGDTHLQHYNILFLSKLRGIVESQHPDGRIQIPILICLV